MTSLAGIFTEKQLVVFYRCLKANERVKVQQQAFSDMTEDHQYGTGQPYLCKLIPASDQREMKSPFSSPLRMF